MKQTHTIRPITSLPLPGFASLLEESERDGYRFVRRLLDEWESGAMRFDRPGEVLFGAFDGDDLVGFCGLSLDPYISEPGAGRVRRLYVRSDMRGTGLGRALVDRVVAAAAGHFTRLRLRTDSPDAAAFYERLGFVRVGGGELETATHVLGVKSHE